MVIYTATVTLSSFSLLFQSREEIGQSEIDHHHPEYCWWKVELVSQSLPYNNIRPSVAGIITTAELDAGSDFALSFSAEEELKVSGRLVPPTVSPNLIRQYMEFCTSRHTETCGRLHPTREVNEEYKIRLIDVKEKCVVPATSCWTYVALSYVWGTRTPPLLTKDTLSQYSIPGSLQQSCIPPTIFDAIQLVFDIGERYLWVDSLCIIQDDLFDKNEQLPIMDRIYGFATLVVVAGAGDSVYAGLRGAGHSERQNIQRNEVIKGVRFITTQPALYEEISESVWNGRGWTYQEAILSKRILVFTEHRVYWNCRSDAWCEDISMESNNFTLIQNQINSIWGPKTNTSNTTTCRTHDYSQRVEAFSSRAFTKKSDVVWAFLGIIKMLQPRFPQGFIWGIPYERLDATLLWEWNETKCCRLHRRGDCHIFTWKNTSYELPYPSWSWLAFEHGVIYKDPCGACVMSEVEWYQPILFSYDDKTQFIYQKHILIKPRRQANASDSSNSEAEKANVDFGLLHFTAKAATLKLRLEIKISEIKKSKLRRVRGDLRVFATIFSSSTKKRIGLIRVPYILFSTSLETPGEFILLSSHARDETNEVCKRLAADHQDCSDIVHVPGCEHIEHYNIMLIEWKEDIAYRISLTQIQKDDWEVLKTQKKDIVLG